MKITNAEFPALYVGDQPAEQAVITVDDDLASFPNVTVNLRKPDGNTMYDLTGIATVADDEIHVALNGGYFLSPGEWSLQVMLSGPGVKQSLPPVPFIVEEVGDWHSLYTAREEWRDAPDDDVKLYRLLNVAKLQVTAYAYPRTVSVGNIPGIVWDDPELPLVPSNWVEDPDNPGFYFNTDELPARPPFNWVQAQLMQCRNIWNAAKTDPSGAIGDNGFEIRPYPMDNFIKQVIRPKRAIPVFGRA